MAKFSSERFPPGFFDLPRDAGETLPLDIIERWTRGRQTRELAREILAPHTLHGAMVSSDSAGLTRLSHERALVEILAMINRPKELVHAFGTAIGGRPLGVWAADNTQMFYPPDISADRLVGTMLTTLDRVAAECEISIGLCAHRGDFLALGTGVYGPDADRVEVVAEEHTVGGELLVTDTLAADLGEGHAFALTRRGDLPAGFGTILQVTGGPRVTDVEPTNFQYPAPFTSVFYEELQTWARTRRDSRMPKHAYRESAVVLIERETEERDVPEVAVLNDLALAAAMKRIGGTLLQDLHGDEIKTSGQISIYVFGECGAAVAFAKGLRQELADQGISCRVGVDVGQVLVFDLGNGAKDIAGSAVNVASKLAQDVGSYGSIYISEAAAAKLGGVGGKRVSFAIAGVVLPAVQI